MPLRVELKPFERIVIGDSVIVNSDARTRFLIEGDAPVLRERDTVTQDSATTPARRLHCCVQLMYLKSDPQRYRPTYLDLVATLRETMPDAGELINAIDGHVAAGSLYRALKDIRTLMKRESDRSSRD